MKNMGARKIILDTDPGIDDAVAFAVLLNACRKRVKLIVASYGNTSVENTTRNALALAALLGADTPVARGAEKPTPGGNGVYEDASYAHGNDGLGGIQRQLLERLPAGAPICGDYVRTVYEAIAEESDPVDYIALGPLTNLSQLIKRYPDAVDRIGRVAIMGGGIGRGNVTEFAEFNIYCDAESANHVFSVMPDITLAPLNATERVALGIARVERIRAAGTAVSDAMARILLKSIELSAAYGGNGEEDENSGYEGKGAVMHDSTAVLAYLYPELFEFRVSGISVDCTRERYGECVPDASRSNVKIADGFDPEQLLDIISDKIITYK